MGRHSKNAGTMGSEGLRYHERQMLGHGTMTERLGAETVKDFHCCALSLSPAIDPVVTPDGVLYDREHILRCLLHQKKEIAKATKAWETQGERDSEKEKDAAEAKRLEAIEKFHLENQMGGDGNNGNGAVSLVLPSGDDPEEASDAAASFKRSQLNAPEAKQMNAFWLPSKTPTAELRKEKPNTHTTCPTTEKKLRMKDLIDVRWTKAPSGDSKYSNARSSDTQLFMCPVTRKTFNNYTQVLVLVPSGDAISEEAYKMVVAKEKSFDGKKVKGVIKLQKGGSGFAGSGTQVESKSYKMLGAGSGLADSRGQQRGGASRFGLKFN